MPEFKEILAFAEGTEKQLKSVDDEDHVGPRICGNIILKNVAKIFDSEPEQGGDGSRYKGKVGLFWTKDEFTALAREATHPLDEEIKVPQRIARVIHEWARLGPKNIKAKREQTLE